MAGPLPHSLQIQALAEKFLADVEAEIAKSRRILSKSREFRTIYRISLAADAALSRLLKFSHRPRPYAVRSIVKGVPLLVSTRQLGPARIELRRFMELVLWDIYFEEHPVEWERFKAKPTHGYTKDEKDPIEYCAHRELDYYLNYAKSRVSEENSGIASLAVDELRKLKGKLNEAVHPGSGAHLTGQIIPLDPLGEDTLRDFAELQRDVLKFSCILLASLRRRIFDHLPAMYRAHFDWLIGDQLAKKIRSGPFGLV
jgi:hypothetical protein